MADPGTHRYARCLVVVALALVCVHCDGEDLSGLETLSLDADDADGAVIAAWSQPYVGRLTVDYGLTHRGDTPTAFRLRAQASTSGDPDDDACERLQREAGRAVDAVADAAGDPTTPDPNASLTVIRDFDDVVAVTLPGDGAAGWIALRVPNDGEFIVRTDVAADLTIRAVDGTEIIPTSDIESTTCAAIATERAWDLEATTWRLRVDADDAPVARLWIEQACPDLRTVPSTCPGAASPIVDEDLPERLEPGGFVSGRIHDTDLGIGDRVTVELACADGPGCAADLEIFFVVTPLECRTDNDCTNAEACSSDAWCIRETSGCSAAPPGAVPPLVAGLAALAFAIRRRR